MAPGSGSLWLPAGAATNFSRRINASPGACTVAPSPRVARTCHAVCAPPWCCSCSPARRPFCVALSTLYHAVVNHAGQSDSCLPRAGDQFSGPPGRQAGRTRRSAPASTPSPSASSARPLAAAMPESTLLACTPARSHT